MKVFIVWFLLCLFSVCFSEEIKLNGKNWKCAPIRNVPVDGCVLTNKLLWIHDGYFSLPFKSVNESARNNCDRNNTVTEIYQQDFTNWIDAVVPGTILTSLLANDIIQDPYFDMNNEYILDIFDSQVDYYTYWYYLEFTLNKEKDYSYFLNLRGINYKADVFLNGKKVNMKTLEGMYQPYSLDITDKLKRFLDSQELGIIVYPPNPPGNGTTGQGGDGTIAKSVTCQYMAGWDWVQTTRDRSTGIWDDVSIEKVRNVKLVNSHFISNVTGTRVPGDNIDFVLCYLSVTLRNLESTTKIVEVFVNFSNGYSPYSITLELLPFTEQEYVLPSFDFPNPKLWWPNGIGESALYTLQITILEGGILLDSDEYKVGFRTIETQIDSITGGRQFFVNGQKIFISGANWIGLDSMMRLNKTVNHDNLTNWYKEEVRMHAEMNMNMIRVWGGGIMERPEFYQACDEFGLLVWQEFWITGDCNGAWTDPVKEDSKFRRRYYPDDYGLFVDSARKSIIMLRNHPSLCIWVGGNEWEPPEQLNETLNYLVTKLDSTRNYIPSSLSSGFGPSDGPYGIQNLQWFYSRNDSNAFNPEMGSIGMPVVETMRLIVKESNLIPFGESNIVWQYHKFIPYYNTNGSDGKNVTDQIDCYGIPSTIEEYCMRAQLANYQQYNALFEGRQEYMWINYTGLLIWKSQNPWTGLRGQLYDWFGEQNAGFYGVKHALEPIHIQLNLLSNEITIINRTPSTIGNTIINATMYNLNELGEIDNGIVFCNSFVEAIEKQEVKNIDCTLPNIANNSICFVNLELTDNENNSIISKNLYWLSGSPESIDAYVQLQDLKIATVEIVLQEYSQMDGMNIISINIQNTHLKHEGIVAFFNRIQVNTLNNERILPVQYSNNYFTLLPEETENIILKFQSHQSEWVIAVSGWNTESICILVNSKNEVKIINCLT